MKNPTKEQLNALRTLYGAEASLLKYITRIFNEVENNLWVVTVKCEEPYITQIPDSENWPDTIDLSKPEPEKFVCEFELFWHSAVKVKYWRSSCGQGLHYTEQQRETCPYCGKPIKYKGEG